MAAGCGGVPLRAPRAIFAGPEAKARGQRGGGALGPRVMHADGKNRGLQLGVLVDRLGDAPDIRTLIGGNDAHLAEAVASSVFRSSLIQAMS